MPAIPAIHERLIADPPARVADVACGVGWAGIAIAKAYPSVRVDGFDFDESSIKLAKANARSAGVEDRVTYEVRDAADPAAAGQYDFVIVVEAIHDLSRPVEVLNAIRQMLRPRGSALSPTNGRRMRSPRLPRTPSGCTTGSASSLAYRPR